MATAILTDLQQRGFVLHPLKGKIPLMKKWQELTSSPPDIDKHVGAGGNVGAVCGKASNITCIDLDSMLFADEIFNGTKIETLCAERTQGRGHVYFKYNERLPASKHHDLNIEILNDGNNIVLPGSKHPSGDVYHWKNPEAPIQDMSAEVEANLIHLFKTETELKRILAKCRHCFRDVIKRKPDMHGADGREMMLAVCTDLAANGADEQHIKMFAKLMYQEKFDEGRTMQEWRNIDPAKTWTCETLKNKLPAYVDLAECEKCEQRRATFQNRPDLVPTPTIIDPYATTDLSNAKRFVRLHQGNIRFIPSRDRWIVFDGKRWVEKKKDKAMVPLVEKMIRELEREATQAASEKTRDKLLKHANNTESENRIMACIRLAASQPEILANPDDFDKDHYLFNFQNGTVDLHTGQLREFRREDMITRIAAVSYIPGECHLWRGFLDKFFAGDVEIIQYMQKLCGMALTGDVSEELFHIFYGGGANGKTTFMTTLNRILGDIYFKTIGVETLLKRGQKAIANDVARMKGARIIWANEPEFDDVLTEGKIKKLVSKERLLGEMKFLEPEEFFPEFTAIMSCNHKPRLIGVDKGIRRRIRFISWSIEITENEKDIHFAEKLANEDPNIAAWAVEGCLLWQKEGLIPPEKILASTADYQDEMDKYAEFFNNIIVRDPAARTPHEMLYLIFKLWTQYQEIYTISKIAFTQMLFERGFKKADGGRIGGRQFKGFEGITLNSESVTVKYSETVTDVTNLLKAVTEYFVAPVYDKQEKYDRLLPILRILLTCFNSGGAHVRTENIVTSVTSVTNDIQSNNIINNQSVTLVTLVTEIKNHLKEQYDQLNKPDSIQDLERLKINMRNSIILELNEKLPENQEIPGNEFIDRIINDYCSVQNNINNNIKENILSLLKESFDRYTNQDLLAHYKTVKEVKAQLELKILTEFEDLSDNIIITEYIDYYCEGRDLRWST